MPESLFPPAYVIALPDGRYIGTTSMTGPIGPAPFAFAYSYSVKADAEQVAASFPGAIVKEL